ncbi:MAG: bifunctional precorrin-2 dehydrogenase/sirohydrochlorin ferrochelatase [Nitrospiraceae bacterium]|nr:MAG: bifunctional precorrin-2 dehydrogenase/sirohydrochlorin ferrochelatase [Nitrospiraceae bacterium]
MNYYPAFLNLEGKKAVVIGGGKVAERKVLTLLRAGAKVTVVSPALTKRLLKEKEAKRIRHISRVYRQGDLKGCFLAIAATDSPEVNTKVAGDAPGLLNVVDVPSECNFIAPSVVRRGPLVFAISTGGTSPAFAKTIRKEIEKLYGSVFSDYLGFVKSLRARAMQEISDKQARERFLKGLASGDILEGLRTKGLTAVQESVMKRFIKLTTKKQ